MDFPVGWASIVSLHALCLSNFARSSAISTSRRCSSALCFATSASRLRFVAVGELAKA